MALSREEVIKVANLARLRLSNDEVEQFRDQLSNVLTYVEQLDQLALDDVSPTAYAVAQKNVWREDEPRPSLPLGDVLKNAPAESQDQFLIQAVLDGD